MNSCSYWVTASKNGGNLCLMKSDASLPADPWPSQTPKRWQ